MSRTFCRNERDGKDYPRKSRKKQTPKKYFGERYELGSQHKNIGYPMELRHKSVIKNKELSDLYDDEMFGDLE